MLNGNQIAKIQGVLTMLAFRTPDANAEDVAKERMEFIKAVIEGPEAEFTYRIQEKPYAPENLCFIREEDGVVISTPDQGGSLTVFFSTGDFSKDFDDFMDDCRKYNETVSSEAEKIDTGLMQAFLLKIKADYDCAFGFERDEPVKEKLYDWEEDYDFEM